MLEVKMNNERCPRMERSTEVRVSSPSLKLFEQKPKGHLAQMLTGDSNIRYKLD